MDTKSLFPNASSFYQFIASALSEEARSENRPVRLEYRVGRWVADVYLPKGLRLFGFEDDWPVFVEAKYDPTEPIFDHLETEAKPEGRRLHFVAICNREPRFPSEYIRYFGQGFVEKLIKRHRDSYLSALLSNPDNVIREGASGQRRLLLAGESEVPLPDDSPERLSNQHERDFRNYMNNDGSGSKCAVFIGNGVSIPFGSDPWFQLINNVCQYLEPQFVEKSEHIKDALSNSSYAIASFVKTVLNRHRLTDQYYNAIHYSIYRKFNPLMHNSFSLIKVLAQAKALHPSLSLFTYNYDTFIEKQFEHETKKSLQYYNGVDASQASRKIPKECVVHLHGYLSYTRKRHQGLVFTDQEYFDAYLGNRSWTYKTQIKALRSKKCLFVGSSMSDLFQMAVINEARKKEEADKKWGCFAILCLRNMGPGEKIELIKYYLEKGIKIIFTESFEELPKKLAGIFGISIKP